MAQPVWITPAGSLGTIPDGVFYQNAMLASTAEVSRAVCTATSATTNRITCVSTSEIYAGFNVMFEGDLPLLGGLSPNIRYFVLEVFNDTEFSIAATEFSTTPIELTTSTGIMTGVFRQHVYFKLIAGQLPNGIQCSDNGLIIGTPNAVASLEGVPLAVGIDTTSKFTVRGYTLEYPNATANIADRTFTLTIAISPGPTWVTPEGSVGTYYDSDQVNFQFNFIESYTPDTTVVELVSGHLPGGLTLAPNGLLSGYVQPPSSAQTVSNASAGYDLTGLSLQPYDFLDSNTGSTVATSSQNYQFTLKVTNGKNSDLRTFTMYVYNRSQMTADDGQPASVTGVVSYPPWITADNTFVTADETQLRAPFITNAYPSDLGTYRSSNSFAYQFIGEDYNGEAITYAISVNQGAGLPPGLTLDPTSGWYYGYIPDQGTTQVEYSFNVVVYQSRYITPAVTVTNTTAGTNRITCVGTGDLTVGQPLIFDSNIGGLTAGTIYHVNSIISESASLNQTVFTVTGATLTTDVGAVLATLAIECTATTTGTNVITCFSTANLGLNQPIVFSGTGFGGITAAAGTVYYVSDIVSPTTFKITAHPGSTSNVVLTTASGNMTANMILASDAYPFTMNITGAVDAEVTWITPTDLGTVINGSVSLLNVEAVNRGGRTLAYRLKSGAYNSLPQGLELLPSGEIAGRVSFDTFSLDLGATTFDKTLAVTRNPTALGTTFDSTYTFTVNAYAPDTTQLIYEVDSVTVTDGGSGYSNVTPPTIVFSSPVGASAVTAEAGTVTVAAGAITAVAVADAGNGYTSPPTISITQGFGGSGAVLTPVMKLSGSRDVISVYKTFTVKVYREYNRPYQNLFVRAMPPPQDRALIRTLLDNETIFPPEYLFRPDDPNFGKSTQVTYAHAYGLAPDTLERYVASLYENHYWKQLVLGEVDTAQALDVNGNVIYEVVYSKIIDDLVNDAGDSVSKIVTLPYAIVDPTDGTTLITSVYPNSLVNMRDQVIDVVGQISTTLPIWMTSKQTNGRVLGFTPSWVIAYTKPGRSREIAYYLQTQFGQQLNNIDFDVDRYILDRTLSRNWDTETQHWTPKANLTTFDRFNTSGYTFIGQVQLATSLAYADVNARTIDYINSLGGIDGRVNIVDGDTLIFVVQEDYANYSSIDDAWQDYEYPFDNANVNGEVGSFDHADLNNTPGAFDYAVTIPNSPVDQRMAIYTIHIDPITGLISLELTTQPVVNDYVQIVRGTFYRSAQLYYPGSPGEGLTQISWLPLLTIVTAETVFDGNSLKFEEPVDMYDPTDTYDKYLVFPKSNILV
jgi:hypothetical protein